MIGKKMESAINDQINAELYSAYLYLSMSAYLSSKNLNGSASWMRVQAQEEQVHAMKLYDYLIERGGRVQLKPIEVPPKEWEDFEDVFKYTYKHEQKVTSLINNLVDIATRENDHATKVFLNWFVTEQVEEEASADEILQKYKLTSGGPNGLFMIDQELGKRAFNPPASSE